MISLHPLHCQEDFAILLAEKTLKRQKRPLRGSCGRAKKPADGLHLRRYYSSSTNYTTGQRQKIVFRCPITLLHPTFFLLSAAGLGGSQNAKNIT
jgi:hypothetical protein